MKLIRRLKGSKYSPWKALVSERAVINKGIKEYLGDSWQNFDELVAIIRPVFLIPAISNIRKLKSELSLTYNWRYQ